MIYILHGGDTLKSRNRLHEILSTHTAKEKLQIDAKSISEEDITLFLGSNSFIKDEKVLVLENPFSLPKAKYDKLFSVINEFQDGNTIILYQNKDLTAAQTKPFSSTKIEQFKQNKNVFGFGYMLQPGKLKPAITEYYKLLSTEPFEFIFYVVRDSLRRQLTSWSKLPIDKVKAAYLQCIELDFQIKSGQLSIPKELALERILQNLLS